MNERLPSTLDPAELETLAAFVDGRLEGAERDAVIARLAEDEAYYEVYAETLHFLEEEAMDETADAPSDEPASPGSDAEAERGPGPLPAERHGRVLSFTGRVAVRLRTAVPLAVAAALVAAFGAMVLLDLLAPRSGRSYAGHLSPRAREVHGVFETKLERWPAMRSGPLEVPPQLSETAIDVQVGVRAMALRAGIGVATPRELHGHAIWIEALTWKRDEYQLGLLQTVGAVLEQPSETARENLDVVLGEVDFLFERRPGFHLGLFVQSCRIAAASGDAAFFRRRSVRSAFNRLRAPMLVPEAAGAALEIERILRGGAEPGDLERLGTACLAIADHGGGR